MYMSRNRFIAAALLAGLALPWAAAQTEPPKTDAPLTLEDAIRLAQANEPAFCRAVAESRAAALERKDAKAALLPSVTFHNQYLFTESNRTRATTTQGATSQSLPAFIANNSIHEYTNQAAVTETLGLAGAASARLASANAVRAQAELEIAAEGSCPPWRNSITTSAPAPTDSPWPSVHSKKQSLCRIDSKAGRRTRSGARRCHQGSPWTTTAPAGNG